MSQQASDWGSYGRAVIASMNEVLAEVHEDHRPLVLETADYWLSLGLAIGLERVADARTLLHLIEPEEELRAELRIDADEFCDEVLR